MKRILITGANGFIGSTLADHALARGWEVTAALRPASDRTYLSDPRIKFLYLHFDNEPALRSELEKSGMFDFVVHLAGTTKALRQEDYFRINTDYTRRFVEILRDPALRPTRFLFLSSLAALGPANGNMRVIPHQNPSPVTTYGASKLAAEQYLESLDDDFPWTVLQPTAVFGPRDKDLFEFVRLLDKGLELYIGREPQRVSFIYIHDLIEMIFAAFESDQAKQQKYIATDGCDYTTSDLGNATRVALQRRTLQLRLPLSIVRMVAAASETIGKWRGKMPPLNREKLNEISVANWWCDTSKTFEELNFLPTHNLQSGIQETVSWYKKNGWL